MKQVIYNGKYNTVSIPANAPVTFGTINSAVAKEQASIFAQDIKLSMARLNIKKANKAN